MNCIILIVVAQYSIGVSSSYFGAHFMATSNFSFNEQMIMLSCNQLPTQLRKCRCPHMNFGEFYTSPAMPSQNFNGWPAKLFVDIGAFFPG